MANLETTVSVNGAAFTVSYIEINNENDLKEHLGTDGTLNSGYYKFVGTSENNSIELSHPLLIAGNVVIDIDSNVTITNVTSGFTVNTGLNDVDALIMVKRGGNLTVQGGGTITNTTTKLCGIKMTVSSDSATSGTAKLTVNGDVKITSTEWFAISGNGNRNGTEITINGGEITGSTAIYHPQEGTLVINGGTIKGNTDSGVEIRSGNLYVTGGTITSNATNYICSPNGNGTTTTGAAIAIAQHNTDHDISVNISGGNFTGAVAVSVSNPNDRKSGEIDLNITGGTFTSTSTTEAISTKNADYRVTPIIGGGSFYGKLDNGSGSSSFDILTDDEGKSFATFAGSSSETAKAIDSATEGYSSFTFSAEDAPKFAIPQLNSAGTLILGGTSVITINQSALDTLSFGSNSTVEFSSNDFTFTLGADVSQLRNASVEVDTTSGTPGIASIGGFSDISNASVIFTTDTYNDYYIGKEIAKIDSTNKYEVKKYDVVGDGAQFTFSGLGSLSSGDIQDGYLTVTPDTVNIDGQYSITNYNFTIRRGLVENMKDGQTITISGASGIGLSLAYDTNGFAVGLSGSIYDGGTKLPYSSASSADQVAFMRSATLTSGDNGTFVYSAQITDWSHYAFYSAGTDNPYTDEDESNSKVATITKTKTIGGQSFAISGLSQLVTNGLSIALSNDSIVLTDGTNSTLLAEIGSPVAAGGVSNVYVTLTAAAFGGISDTTITLTDLDSSDSVEYYLVQGGLAGDSTNYVSDSFIQYTDASGSAVANTYVYAKQGHADYYALSTVAATGDSTAKSTITFRDGDGGKIFTVNQLEDDLSFTVGSDGYITASLSSQGVVTVGSYSDNVLTLIDTDILKITAGSPRATITLTDLDTTDTVTYGLSASTGTGKTEFNYSASYNEDTDLSFDDPSIAAVEGTSGAYTYYDDGYAPAYTYRPTSSGDTVLVYNKEEGNTFGISGLRDDLTEYLYGTSGIIGTAKDETSTEDRYSLGDFITLEGSTVNINSYDVLPTFSSSGASIIVTVDDKNTVITALEANVVYIPFGLKEDNFSYTKAAASFADYDETKHTQDYTTRTYKAILDSVAGNSLALTVARGEVGGDTLQFSGFIPLTNTDKNLEPIGYDTATDPDGIVAASDESTDVFSANPVFDSESGNITGYTFELGDSAAIDWKAFRGGSATVLSVTSLGEEDSTVPVTLKINTGIDNYGGASGGDGIPDILQPVTVDARWEDRGTSDPLKGRYVYHTAGRSEYFLLGDRTAATDYNPETTTFNSYIYQKEAESTTAIEVGGITSTNGFSVVDKVATLNAANFTESVSVISNAGGYTLGLSGALGSGKTATFTGLSLADTISNSVAGLAINGLSGNDIINNFASNVTINGGDDNDTITSSGVSSFIYGGSGADYISVTGNFATIYGDADNDTIISSGNNAFINGGADGNIISLTGGENVTVNVSDGDDTIKAIDNIGSFSVAGFSAGDVINFGASVTALDTITGGIKVTLDDDGSEATIYGLDYSDTLNTWKHYSASSIAIYGRQTLAGAYIDNDGNIAYRDSIDNKYDEALLALSGIISTAGFSVDDGGSVTLNAAGFSEVVTLLKNDYSGDDSELRLPCT